MNRILRTLTSGRLWINLLLVGVVLLIIVQLVMFWLRIYTRHGDSLTVPNLSGLSMEKVETLLENVDLSYEITDSIYSDEVDRGVVVMQNPSPEKSVKKGRTIFITVNSVLPEMVEMPDLMGKSRRIALPLLEIAGLELENLSYRPDETCTDCVIDFLYEGKQIEAGDKIRKGEKITVVLGQASNELTAVPRILGLSYRQAAELINNQSLNMGEILACSGCNTAIDTNEAFVVNQVPSAGNEINLGSFIDVFLSTDPDMARALQQTNDTSNYEMD